jgi:hypothetical protein
MIESQRSGILTDDYQCSDQSYTRRGTIIIAMPIKIAPNMPPVHEAQDVRAMLVPVNHGSPVVMTGASIASVPPT